MPRMLYAQVKRSPYPHARILRIDTSKAEALPGVRSVITGDCYTKRCGLYLEDKNFLAVGTAKYRGEAVAAVAAETPEIADEAVELIEVEYEQLPAVTNAVEGMKPDAPLIHPDLHTYKVAPIFHPVPHTNISHHYKLRKGDVDKAFEACDVVTENTYYHPPRAACAAGAPLRRGAVRSGRKGYRLGVYPVPLRSAPGPVRRL